MAWKLTKDNNNPMWGNKPQKVPKEARGRQDHKPPKRPLQPKLPVPPGYKYVWHDK